MKKVCLLIVLIFSIHFVGFGQTAEYYLDRGNKDYDNRNYESALWDFNSSISLNPNNYKAYNSRGNAKYMLGDYKGAYNDYDKAVKLNPNDRVPWDNRELAKSKMNKNNENPVSQGYSAELSSSPSDIAMAEKLKEQQREGELKGTLAWGGEVVNKETGAVTGLSPQALSFSKPLQFQKEQKKVDLNKLKEDIRQYNQAIANNPNDKISYYNRGLTKYELGDYRGACLDWSKAGELGLFDAYDLINEYCK